MKTMSYIVLVLAGVLFFGSAEQSNAGQPKDARSVFANSLADGGRVRMKHSPGSGNQYYHRDPGRRLERGGV